MLDERLTKLESVDMTKILLTGMLNLLDSSLGGETNLFQSLNICYSNICYSKECKYLG